MVDIIHNWLYALSLWMPLFVIGVLIAHFKTLPAGNRSGMWRHVLIGVATGFIGSHAIEPIEPGGWNWQFMFYPFLFAKWFFIGFMTTWGISAIRVRTSRVTAVVVLVFAAVPLLMTVADMTYVRFASQRDRTHWDAALEVDAPIEQLELSEERLSAAGRDRIRWHLHYRPNEIEAPVLVKLHELGFDVLHARNTPHEIRDTAVATTKSKISSAKPAWEQFQMLQPLASLALNPTLSDSHFEFLAAVGNDSVISALIRNEGNSDIRIKALRDVLANRIAEIEAASDSSVYYRNKFQRLLKHIDKRLPETVQDGGESNPR